MAVYLFLLHMNGNKQDNSIGWEIVTHLIVHLGIYLIFLANLQVVGERTFFLMLGFLGAISIFVKKFWSFHPVSKDFILDLVSENNLKKKP